MEEDAAGDPPAGGSGSNRGLDGRSGSKRGRSVLEAMEAGNVSDGGVDAMDSEVQNDRQPAQSYASKLKGSPSVSFPSSYDEDDADADKYVSDDDVYESDDEDGPRICLTRDEKQRIRRPWRKTLIVKLLGKTVSYTYLCNRVKFGL